MQNDRKKKPKSEESARFLQFKDDSKLTWEALCERLGVPVRTMQHYCWNTGRFSDLALRRLHSRFALSIDWLLSGKGDMYGLGPSLPQVASLGFADVSSHEAVAVSHAPLFAWREFFDTQSAQDCFYLFAAAIEQSLLESGATPGVDYSRLDLVKLAQPFVLQRHVVNPLDFLFYESGSQAKD